VFNFQAEQKNATLGTLAVAVAEAAATVAEGHKAKAEAVQTHEVVNAAALLAQAGSHNSKPLPKTKKVVVLHKKVQLPLIFFQCTMHNAQYTNNSMHNAQCTMHNAQCTMHNA